MTDRFSSPMLAFADATAAIMAGVFVLAFALIQIVPTSSPGERITGRMQVTLPIIHAAHLMPDLDLIDEILVAKITANGSPIPLKQQPGIPYSYQGIAADGQLSLTISKNDTEIIVQAQVDNILDRVEWSVDLTWSANTSPTFWPRFVSVRAFGSAVNEHDSRRFRDNPRCRVNGFSKASGNTQMRINGVFDPRDEGNTVSIELLDKRKPTP